MTHKNILFFFLAICLQLPSNAQEVSKGDKNDLDMQSLLKKIPSFDVRDKQGNVYKLNEYITNNKMHNEKPFLIVLWGTDGEKALGVNKLNALDSAKLGDKFNIVALCVSHEKDKNKQPENLKELLTEYKVNNKWGKFLVAVTDWDGINNFYLTSFPKLIYADKKMNIVSIGMITNNGFEKEILNDIEKGLVKMGEAWYNNDGDRLEASNPKAYYYTKYTIINDQINIKTGTKKNILNNISYIKKDNEYLMHGLMEANYETGSVQQSGEFNAGAHSTTYKAWYEDGSLAKIIPVNGTLKFFDKNGKVIYEGTMKNGLGDGLFTEYANDKKAREKNYVAGVLFGIQKEFKTDGTLYNESFASPLFQATEVLTYTFKEGLQRVVIKGKYGFVDRQGNLKIPAIYEHALHFDNGSALVTLGGEEFYINKKGERTN